MAITAVKQQQIMNLISVYDRVVEEFAKLDQPTLTRFANSWPISRRKYLDMLEGRQPGIKASALVDGLKQGLGELPLIVGDLPAEVRRKAMQSYCDVVDSELPQFLEKMRVDAQAIIERKRIKNEREFYLVRLVIDQLEQKEEKAAAQEFYQLVDEYEAR